MLSQTDKLQMQIEMIRILEVLMRTKIGFNSVLSAENGIRTLALCMDIPQDEVRSKVFKLLTVVCIASPSNQLKVMDGMKHYKDRKKEKQRFSNLLAHFEYAPTMEEKVNIMTFINALVNTPTDLDVRISIRSEFEKLGFDKLLKVRTIPFQKFFFLMNIYYSLRFFS